MPIYNYAESVYVGTKTIYPSKYILIDGILLFTTQTLRDCFDLKIYIDCNKDIRSSRRLKRDVIERGANVDLIKHQLNKFVIPMHNILIEPNKIFANITFDNSASKTERLFKSDISDLYNNIIRKFREKLLLDGNIIEAQTL